MRQLVTSRTTACTAVRVAGWIGARALPCHASQRQLLGLNERGARAHRGCLRGGTATARGEFCCNEQEVGEGKWAELAAANWCCTAVCCCAPYMRFIWPEIGCGCCPLDA